MASFTVQFTVPAVVTVRLDATSEDEAVEAARHVGAYYVEALAPDRGASVRMSLDDAAGVVAPQA